MNNQWDNICPLCHKLKTGINNYFCIQNTKSCEQCLAGNTKKVIKKHRKEIDPFEKWRPKNLPVDKRTKSGFGTC